MSIEYGNVLRIRFKTKEEGLFFVNRVTEDGFELLTIDGEQVLLSFEDSDILEVSVVYIPPKPDYASIRNLSVRNWVHVQFIDKPLYGTLVKTGSTLEIESNQVMYYIPVRYGLPKDIVSIDISKQPFTKTRGVELEVTEPVVPEADEEPPELYDVEDDYDQLFYTMEQKKNDLTEALLQNLEKQSQTSLKKVYHQVQRFQELFEKYTMFEKNILLKRLPEKLYQDSFTKNENEFFTPVSNHIKVKHNFTENEKRVLGSVPDYYFRYDEPASTYEMYIQDTIKQMPYEEFIIKEAKVVQNYDVRKNHTEHEFYPSQNREVYLLSDLAKYKVNEPFVTDSVLLQPHALSRYTRRGSTLLAKVRQSRVPYLDMYFRNSMDVVPVNESYSSDCILSDRMTWFKNECSTFQAYIEKLVPSFQSFMNCYIEKDFVNIYQALYELEILHMDEMNGEIYKEVVDVLRSNITKCVEERIRDKKQALRKKPELFIRENHELHRILHKEYGLGPRNEKMYYTTSELWKEGMFDCFHFYVIQYLRKHALLQQVVTDEEMVKLVDEIKNAFGKEPEERIHKVYENEQQRESDQYKFVLQDIPRGTKIVSADEELYRKLLQDKNSSLTLDEVKIKLNQIKDGGEKEIPNLFDKELVAYIQEFLLKNKIMKEQIAFVRETGKKYKWDGEAWVDLTNELEAKSKKICKVKGVIYNEESFQKKIQEMIHAFESEKLRSQAIHQMKLEDESHKLLLEKSKIKWLKEKMKYHTEKYQLYEIELQKELVNIQQSPYLSLRNRILQEVILENKYKAIQLFVQQYTKTGEDVHWFYCLETGVKLLPIFFMELAEAFLKSNNYPKTLQLICDRQGELSDNHDFYVDKYSGFPIKQIQFDEEEDFNDQGFRDIFHSAVEKEMEVTEVDTQNPVRNALKTFLNLMGLVPEDESLEDILADVEKSFLLASGDKKKTREQNQIYIYSILSHSLIYGQTLEGKVRLSKPFPDCPKSLKGFPLNPSSKKGLEFVCCIVAKMPKPNEPWNSMGQVKLEKLLEMSELFIQKYVLPIQSVGERLYKKLEVQEKMEEFPVWTLFYPRLRPIQVVPELSDYAKDRIIGLSLLLQQRIHTYVSTQTAVLVNQAQEPYLINTCCQTQNDVYEYFLEHAKWGAILKELYELLKKENKRKHLAMTYHMYCPMNTKMPPSKISGGYDEKTIYRAVIKIFLLDTDASLPEKLKKYKVIKPAEYKKNDPFEKKFELLKQIPINESTFVSILRDNAKIFERRKGRVLEEVNVGSQPLDVILQEKKEKDLYDFCIVSIEDKMKVLLSKARDRTERKKFQQCFQFYTLFREEKQNDFLPRGMEHKESMTRILYNKIEQLLHVFPAKIYNNASPPRKLPQHWKLDERHIDNIMEFTRQYDENITNFYENETWKIKFNELDFMDYERWMKIPCNISMKYTLYCYIYVSIFHDLVEKGLLDYVKTVVGIFLDEDKLALNFDKKQIDFLSDMAKKSETEIKTDRLKKLTKDARKAQNAMKDLKLGEWGVGLDKSLFKYDKSKYSDVLDEANKITEGMDVPDELYGTYGVDDGDNLEGFDGDEYYS